MWLPATTMSLPSMKTFWYWAPWIAKPRTALPSPPISSPLPPDDAGAPADIPAR
jgi:hypothetical protein